jgi:hypothetical protein
VAWLNIFIHSINPCFNRGAHGENAGISCFFRDTRQANFGTSNELRRARRGEFHFLIRGAVVRRVGE